MTTYTSALTGRVGIRLISNCPCRSRTDSVLKSRTTYKRLNTNRIRIGCDVVEMEPDEVPAFRFGGQVNVSVPTLRYAPFRAADFRGRGTIWYLHREADNTSGAAEGDEMLMADDSLVRRPGAGNAGVF